MARYILSHIIIQQQGLFLLTIFFLIKKTISSSRHLEYQRKTAKGKIPYKYSERTACKEHDMAKIGTNHDDMEKLIVYHMHLQYHKKPVFEKVKTFLDNHRTIHCFL